MSAVAARIVGLLPVAVQPFAKAIVPAVLVLVSVGVQALVTGQWDPTAIDAGVHGLAMAILVFVFPNAGGSDA